MRKTIIVLLPVEHYDRIEDAEKLENQNFYSFQELHDEFANREGDQLVFTLPNFMLHCNDQTINLELYWITYVNLLS